MKQINYEGKLYTVNQLAQKTGISRHTIENRLQRGWDAKATAETPVNHHLFGGKAVSKAEGEWYLDSLKFEDLPKPLRSLKFSAQGNRKVTKWGKHIRLYHKAAFDSWFENEFLPSQTLNESKTS